MLVHPDTSFSAVSHKINFRMVSKLEKLEVVLACLERDISFFLGTSVLCMSESVVTVQTTFPQLLNSSIVVNSPATDFCELCLAPPFQDHCKDQDKYEEACEESLMSPPCLESQGLSFDFTLLSPFLFFCPVLLLFLSYLFSACWSILLHFFQKILPIFFVRRRLFCTAPV